MTKEVKLRQCSLELFTNCGEEEGHITISYLVLFHMLLEIARGRDWFG